MDNVMQSKKENRRIFYYSLLHKQPRSQSFPFLRRSAKKEEKEEGRSPGNEVVCKSRPQGHLRHFESGDGPGAEVEAHF